MKRIVSLCGVLVLFLAFMGSTIAQSNEMATPVAEPTREEMFEPTGEASPAAMSVMAADEDFVDTIIRIIIEVVQSILNQTPTPEPTATVPSGYNATTTCSSPMTLTMKVITATQNMNSADFAEAERLTNHMETALSDFTEGCVDINIIATQQTADPVIVNSEGQPHCAEFANQQGWGGADLVMLLTDPSVTFSPAAGHQDGNCLWVETGNDLRYIASHELAHWADLQYGINISCETTPPHCHGVYGYGVNTVPWWDFYFDQVYWPNAA